MRKCIVEPDVAISLREWSGRNHVVVLLIHGVAEGGFVWDDFASAVAQFSNVIAVDMRGHGESSYDPSGGYTLDKFTNDISKLIGNLETKNLILVGHSLGATVAAKIAPELKSRLRALVLVDSGPGRDDETARYLHQQLRQAHRPYERVEEYAQWLKEHRFFAKPAVLERLANSSLRSGLDGFYRLKYDLAVTDMLLTPHDDTWWLPTLGQIHAPVLVVRGMASASVSRRTAEQLAGAAKRGKLVVVPDAGHAVMNDNIEGFARAVVPFVAHVSATAEFGGNY